MLPTNGDPTSVHDKVSHVAVAQNNMAKLATLTDPVAIEKTKAIIFNNIVDAVLCGIFMVIVVIVTIQCIRICLKYTNNADEASKAYPLSESEIKDAALYANVRE